MKSLIHSIPPKQCEKIANGEQTILLAKGFGNKEVPFKEYIYCTKSRKRVKWLQSLFGYTDELYKLPSGEIKFGSSIELMCCEPDLYTRDNFLNGKVIGEFVCNQVDKIIRWGMGYHIKDKDEAYTNEIARKSCLYFDDLHKYFGDKGGEALHISELKIYDKPKELSEFKRPCIMPEQPCCEHCEYGRIIYSDDCETSRDIEGSFFEAVCYNCVKCAPRNYCHCTELGEKQDEI